MPTSCALTQGYTNDCRKSVGGAKEVLLIEKANVTTITQTAGKVTAIVKVSTTRFWRYKTARNTAYGKFSISSNVTNGSLFYMQEVGFALNQMSTNTSTELSKVAQNNLLAIVRDQNGVYWLYGAVNGLDVTGGDGGTGTASADRNGYSLVLTSEEPDQPIEVDAATVATLETPGT